ncbi:MAG: 2-C-methyl-D-erythritol 4-phosphate cytidylyltransferase [Desulfobacteraceae bacterium]
MTQGRPSAFQRKTFAVVVAGGKGVRMHSGVRKQYLNLAGRPILVRTLEQFVSSPDVHKTVLVIPEQDRKFCRDHLLKPWHLTGSIRMVAGGKERQSSVRNGLEAVENDHCRGEKKIVLVHDAVRPFAGHEMIRRCIDGAEAYGACVPAIPVVDTLKKADAGSFVARTRSREHLFQVQTPQAFELSLILRAHALAEQTGFAGTDDASLVEQMGEKVFIVEGSRKNIKITTSEDLELAELFCSNFWS